MKVLVCGVLYTEYYDQGWDKRRCLRISHVTQALIDEVDKG